MAAMREGEDQRGGDFRWRVVFRWLPEIHGDYHAEIIVSADDAVDRGDHYQPDDARIERGLKGEEFSEEAAGGGQSQQRKQEQGEARGEHGLLRAQARVIGNFQALFVTLAEMRDHQERADFHQRVGREVEKHGGDTVDRAGSESDQNVSGMGDRGIRQHAFYVGLHQRGEIADAHGEDSGNPYGPEPQVVCRAEGDAENSQHQREGGGFGRGSEQRGDGRGRAFVNVRAVNLEGRGDDFEAEADEDQREADDGEANRGGLARRLIFRARLAPGQCAWFLWSHRPWRCRRERRR